MADFSHLTNPPLSHHLRVFERRGEICTAQCRQMVQLFDPPLLDQDSMAALDYHLSEPFEGRRGRFKTHHSRAGIARQLARIHRDDVPAPLLNVLIALLSAPVETPERRLSKAISTFRKKRREQRESMIFELHEQARRPANERLSIVAKLMDCVDPDTLPKSASQRAIALTQTVLHTLRLNPPSRRRLRNFISEVKSQQKT